MSGLANEVIELLERLPVTQGGRVGEKLSVLPWQRRLIRGVVCNRTSAISVARGCGKSTICAGLAVAALVGPMRQRRGEIVVVASSHAQARVIFEHVQAFISGLIERYPRRFRIADSANSASLEDRETGCRVRCIGSDPRRLTGWRPRSPSPTNQHNGNTQKPSPCWPL